MNKNKYRAKSTIGNKDWVYGYYVYDVEWAKASIWNQQRQGAFYKCSPTPVDDITVGLFTGLKDKNGVEIYQGDIIEGDSGFKYDVRFGEWGGAIGFYVDTKSALGDYPIGSDNYNGINTAIKVIGNIHENQELLTK